MLPENRSFGFRPFDQYWSRGGGSCRNKERGNMYILVSLALILLHLLVLPIYLYLTWHHKYWRKRGLITARPLTLLGTYPGLLTRKSNLVEDVQKIYDKYKGKHRAVGVFVTRQPQILVLDPELAHEVLVGNFRCYKDSLTSSYIRHAKWDKYAKLNPFWASGRSWRHLRSDAQAGITGNRLKQAYNIWEQGGKMLTDYMTQQVTEKNNILETRDLCFRYTAHVMADFIWGIDAGTLTRPLEKPNKVQEMASKWTSYCFYMLSIFMASIVAPCSRLLLRFRFYPKETDEFFSNLTKESIELRLKGGGDSSRTDYLSHLLQLRDQKQATHDDLVGHALTVMLDGYDTTGTALLHALYYLAESPTVQQKLRMEILNSVESEKSLDFDKLCSLPYLEQVVYESLRLSSLIPQYTKVCTFPTIIQLNEFKRLDVEDGMTIMIPNYQFHHDKQYFPEPEAFKPERFDNGAYQELMRKGIFIPFSDGPRICMGIPLALLTLKSAIVHILSDFQVVRGKERLSPKGDAGFGVVLQGDVNLEYRRFLR
ncbi:probable cytochrome P450 309a2 [Drosophila subpulchrella]|uniref:probable cytochrome P450 309a2 n=1 Tax=Drosophila subpulchrella TaxID=1486046 RepID=UPI0018A15674|nr:probable cytochrome P450 309a2 [Drosophila subpulchrella]XP_037710538.1 probable cytochrome P450 309a2 [Drosophila subpulchrella]